MLQIVFLTFFGRNDDNFARFGTDRVYLNCLSIEQHERLGAQITDDRLDLSVYFFDRVNQCRHSLLFLFRNPGDMLHYFCCIFPKLFQISSELGNCISLLDSFILLQF